MITVLVVAVDIAQKSYCSNHKLYNILFFNINLLLKFDGIFMLGITHNNIIFTLF